MMRNTTTRMRFAAVAALVAASSATAAVTSIFATGFEPSPAVPPYVLGNLYGQNGWEVDPKIGSAMIIADKSAPSGGVQTLMLTSTDAFVRATMPHLGIPEEHTITSSFTMSIPQQWSDDGGKTNYFARGILAFNTDGEELNLHFGVVQPQMAYQELPKGAMAFFIELRAADTLVAGAYKEIDYDCIWNAWHTYQLTIDTGEQGALLRVDGQEACKLTWRHPISLSDLHSISLDNTRKASDDGASLYFDDLLITTGATTCYADCDESQSLNIADFTCFLKRFAAGDPWANCDESVAEPILNVSDFTCFLQQFSAGCPTR
jgi:hypothetical protein